MPTIEWNCLTCCCSLAWRLRHWQDTGENQSKFLKALKVQTDDAYSSHDVIMVDFIITVLINNAWVVSLNTCHTRSWVPPQDSAFSSPTPAPLGVTLPGRAWLQLNRLRTGVGRFRSCLCKCGMVTSAACECGAEEQTVDHAVLHCPIHQPPHQLHGLTVLDDDTIEWLLNTCPKI